MGNSQSSSSPPVDKKTGSEWTYKLYFEPRADLAGGHIYRIAHKDLKQKFAELVDVKEDIKLVEAFRRPLFEWQVTQELSHHLFILFETKHWWWSIEKDTEGITVQRSLDKKWVRDFYRREPRKTGAVADIEFVDSDKGSRTVEKLIEWLYNKKELDKRYNLYTSNCQHFGIAVFNMLAKSKKLYSGSKWTYQLYFDPTPELQNSPIYRISDEDLIEQFAELVDVSEDIVLVEAFRHSLFEWQVSAQLSRLHLYIVFKTKSYWWSIEKDIEGIAIQRSRGKEWVRDYYKRTSRDTGLLSGVVHLDSDQGDKTVKELIEWIYKEDELNKPYNDLTSNSQQFAAAVFKTLAQDKQLESRFYT